MFIQLQKQSRSRSRDIQGRSASVSCTSHIPEPVRLRIVSCVWGCVGVCINKCLRIVAQKTSVQCRNSLESLSTSAEETPPEASLGARLLQTKQGTKALEKSSASSMCQTK